MKYAADLYYYYFIILLLFCYKSKRRAYICMYVFCLSLPQMSRLEFFPNLYFVTRSKIHVGFVAPLKGTLTQPA